MKDIPYVSAVESLMYAQVCTRPDLAFATGMFGRYQKNPGKIHWVGVKKVLLSVFNRLPTEGYTQGGKFWVRRRRDQELEGARNTKLRQVRAARCVTPYVLYGGLYCFRCRMIWRSSVLRGVPVLPYISERPGLQRY
jgi:hypothetical protein